MGLLTLRRLFCHGTLAFLLRKARCRKESIEEVALEISFMSATC